MVSRLNPEASQGYMYCPFASGDEYMRTLNVGPGDKWPYMAIFAAFCVSNWALVYFFVYTVRIRGWSFGFGFVFGGLGRLLDVVLRPFQRKRNGA